MSSCCCCEKAGGGLLGAALIGLVVWHGLAAVAAAAVVMLVVLLPVSVAVLVAVAWHATRPQTAPVRSVELPALEAGPVGFLGPGDPATVATRAREKEAA